MGGQCGKCLSTTRRSSSNSNSHFHSSTPTAQIWSGKCASASPDRLQLLSIPCCTPIPALQTDPRAANRSPCCKPIPALQTDPTSVRIRTRIFTSPPLPRANVSGRSASTRSGVIRRDWAAASSCQSRAHRCALDDSSSDPLTKLDRVALHEDFGVDHVDRDGIPGFDVQGFEIALGHEHDDALARG